MAEIVKLGVVNRPLTCEEHDQNIDAVLDRANHTGVQSCNTIESASLNTCISQSDSFSDLSENVQSVENRLVSIEEAIQGGGTIQQDIQSLRNEFLNEITQVEIVLNNHDIRLTSLEDRANGFDSSIVSVDGRISFEVSQLQNQITTNISSIGSLQSVNANQTSLINSNTNAVNNEIANRQNAIASVNTTITNETSNRIAGDNNLRTSLNSETNSRISGDNNLDNKISTEKGERESEDTKIRNEFSTADTNLQSQINTLSGALNGAVPTGTMVMWAGKQSPSGWLLCDGKEYSTSTYSNLFSVIGTQYGSSRSGRFNVPDLRTRYPRSMDSPTESNQGGQTGGNSSVVLATSMMPVHNHTVELGNHFHTYDAEHFHGINFRGHTHSGGGGGSHFHRLDRDAPIGEDGDEVRVPALTAGDYSPSDFTIGPGGLHPMTEPATSGTAIGTAYVQAWPSGESFNPGNRTNNISFINPGIGGAKDRRVSTASLGSKTSNNAGGNTAVPIEPSYFKTKFIIKT